MTLPQGPAGPGGRRGRGVDFRHVLPSLHRKPMALLNWIYRDDLFPRDAYRRTFEALLRDLDGRKACRRVVDLLALAHDHCCEARMAAELDALPDAGRLPDPPCCASASCQSSYYSSPPKTSPKFRYSTTTSNIAFTWRENCIGVVSSVTSADRRVIFVTGRAVIDARPPGLFAMNPRRSRCFCIGVRSPSTRDSV